MADRRREAKEGTAASVNEGQAVMAIHPIEKTHGPASPLSAEENISEPKINKAHCGMLHYFRFLK